MRALRPHKSCPESSDSIADRVTESQEELHVIDSSRFCWPFQSSKPPPPGNRLVHLNSTPPSITTFVRPHSDPLPTRPAPSYGSSGSPILNSIETVPKCSKTRRNHTGDIKNRATNGTSKIPSHIDSDVSSIEGSHSNQPSIYMATTLGSGQGDTRRGVSSPRPKGRGSSTTSGRKNQLSGGTENNKSNTLCRNVSIYGHCRYEDQGRSVLWRSGSSIS